MKRLLETGSSVKNVVRSLKVPAGMTLNSVNAVRSLSMAEKITFEESEIKTIMKN